MKSTLLFGTAVCLLLAGAVITFGNIAPPSSPVVRSKQVKSTLVIVPDGNARGARLQIPRESVRQLRAALDNLPADDSTNSKGQSIARNSTSNIMAGLFMFFAVSFGGVWLARSGHSRNQKAVGAVVITAALMGVTAMITRGNAAPPPGWTWYDLSKNLNGGRETKGSVEIEIVPEGNGIKLIVPNVKVVEQPGEE